MFRFLTFRRKSRRPAVLPTPAAAAVSTTAPLPRQNRISTLSNATTLHPSQPHSELPATLLSSFPAPPTSPFLPIQQNTTTVPTTNRNQDANANLPAPQYPHTFLPNISQSSLDTLADPLGRLPNAPNRLSTFEAFVNSARAAEMRRLERDRYMVRLWMAAEEERRRQAGRSLSGDPWRGRFGPPAGECVGTGLGIGMGGFGQVEVRRELERAGEGGVQRSRSGGKVQGAKVWLRKVTSLERLRV